MRARFWMVPGIAIGLGCISASAADLFVDPAGSCAERSPCFTTIQAGINAAANGDFVVVGPGTYVENINFLGKAITVTAEQGPDVTVIDGNRLAPVVTFASGEGRASVLSGFTVQNGSANSDSSYEGGGIAISFASPTVTGNVITNNFTCSGGGGVAINFGSPLILQNVIRNNSQTGCSGGIGGGGVSVSGASTAEIIENTITNNSHGFWGGGITLFASGGATLRSNIISRNSSGSQGGGIFIVNDSPALLVQNLITGNRSGEGGGILWSNPPAALVNNTIIDNDATQGSGISAGAFRAETKVANNIVAGLPNRNAILCGTTIPNPLNFRSNDVFTPAGTPYGGMCADQTGQNGNISADPLFVDPASSDYHLQNGSPCINAGDASLPELPLTDLDGNDRVVDGMVDMGVYEWFLQVRR